MQTQNPPLLEGEIRLIGGLNERLFRLLAAIETTGSIRQAALDVGLTYKGAWEMLERANNLSPQVLVSTAIGGKQGGGSQLTGAGKMLLRLFLQIQAEHQQFLTQINQRLATNQEFIFLLKRLIMKTSARNQFFGKVTQLSVGAVNVELLVALSGGETIAAQITKESLETLAIKTGSEVLVLIKTSQIILVTDFGGFKLSARNQLAGIISRVQKGAVNAEVTLELKGGNSIAATITNESLETLELAVGNPATAVFKAGAVILGVTG